MLSTVTVVLEYHNRLLLQVFQRCVDVRIRDWCWGRVDT